VQLLTLPYKRYLFRRAAFGALQSPPTSLVLRPRSITTSTRLKLQPSRQWAVTPFQRRFASEEAHQSTAAKTVDEIAAQSLAHTEGETSSTVAEPASTDGTATQVEAGDVAGKQFSQESLTSKAESAAAEALGSFSQPSGPSTESPEMNQELLQPSATSGTAQATQETTTWSSEPFSSTAAASPSPPASYLSPPLTPNNTIYVGNLYFEVSEDGLQRHFTPFGPIKKTRIVYDHRGLSKG
jgi:nucleolin